MQNRAPETSSAWQLAQWTTAGAVGWPHDMQNRAPAGLPVPHCAQATASSAVPPGAAAVGPDGTGPTYPLGVGPPAKPAAGGGAAGVGVGWATAPAAPSPAARNAPPTAAPP